MNNDNLYSTLIKEFKSSILDAHTHPHHLTHPLPSPEHDVFTVANSRSGAQLKFYPDKATVTPQSLAAFETT